RSVIREGKTTGDSVAPASQYWLRLRFNMQLHQYVLAARREGWEIACVIYDVLRKPSIKPRKVDDLDQNQQKIVVDANGVRQYLVAGKNKRQPRQSGDKAKGWIVKSHIETPDEFGQRLYDDALARPEFYFCRREVPVLEDELQQFERQRIAIARLINS